MAADGELLGDVKMAYVEGFDQGKRAMFCLALKKPIEIKGRMVANVMVVLEEGQLAEIAEGMMGVANLREVAKRASRLFKPDSILRGL